MNTIAAFRRFKHLLGTFRLIPVRRTAPPQQLEFF
jgi:hypothetical protein